MKTWKTVMFDILTGDAMPDSATGWMLHSSGGWDFI